MALPTAPQAPQDSAHSTQAQAPVPSALQTPEVAAILARKRDGVPRSRQVFVNRDLQLSRVDAIGFDMDYTVAIYHRRAVEELSFDMTLVRLVRDKGYPADIGALKYDLAFVVRGLVVDRQEGNLLKADRFSSVGRAYHGRQQLTDEDQARQYHKDKLRLSSERFAWIDTLFALPEACLFAEIIELLEGRGEKVNYGKLYDDIRESIDTVHRDNSLKTEIKKDIGKYVMRDPELAPMLHKLRSGGKRVFLLTNSLWDYTDAVMKYLLDGALHEYAGWRNYFDAVIVGASKPNWFSEQNPFLEVDAKSGAASVPAAELHTLERSKVYQGGNLPVFEKLFGSVGDKVLYVGDHIYGDILRSRKSSLWRTCLVIQEMEDEVAYTDAHQQQVHRLAQVEVLRGRLTDEVNRAKYALNALDKRLERQTISAGDMQLFDEDRKAAKAELDLLRRALKEATDEAETLETTLESGHNPYWGFLFKEGNENSRFGEQVEQYACIYTSRISNLLHVSPTQYLRSPREMMPHEQLDR